MDTTTEPVLTQPDGTWCDDCRGYGHMPWCPNYEELVSHVHDYQTVEGQSVLQCACGAVRDYGNELQQKHPPLRSLAEAQRDREARQSRPLIPSRRQLFEPPLLDELDFRSLPYLLQLVGNWMEQNNVEDPEFDGLRIERTFPDPASDECRYTATLYYHREGDKL